MTLFEEIKRLATPAFVGRKDAIARLAEIAEITFGCCPAVSAAAYRELVTAVRHKVFVVNCQVEEVRHALSVERELVRQFKIYIEDQANAMESKWPILATAPSFSEYECALEIHPNLRNVVSRFAECLDLPKWSDDGWIFNSFHHMAYCWLSFRFEAPAADSESKIVVTETGRYFDPERTSKSQADAYLWPLIKHFVAGKGSRPS